MQHDNLIGRGPRARKLRVRAPRTLQPRLNIASWQEVSSWLWSFGRTVIQLRLLSAALSASTSSARRLSKRRP